MEHSYNQLPQYKISQGTIFNRRGHKRSTKVVGLANPATEVMTDLKATSAFTIDVNESIVAANDKMILCGVRLLFVTKEDGSIAGLVTAADILGEKPVQYITQYGVQHCDILVKEIMTPKDKLEVIKMPDVVVASLGDIIETIKNNHRQHLLVVESKEDGSQESIRGIFSTTQIGRQTGITIEPRERTITLQYSKTE